MLKKCAWILILLAVSLTAVAAQAVTIYNNGDFEDDAALVPNPFDTVTAIPTGWQYDNYYGYGVQPELMNVSAIGDGSGGTVGVKFPNWNVEGGWDSVITRFEQPVEPGQYTYTVTLTGVDMIGDGNWLTGDVWWTNNLADPWNKKNYGLLASTGWVELTESDNGVWQTHVVDFVVLPDDPSVGTYFSPWIHSQNYDGNIILGEATLVYNPVPEPSTMLLLGSGLTGLAVWRRKNAA